MALFTDMRVMYGACSEYVPHLFLYCSDAVSLRNP